MESSQCTYVIYNDKKFASFYFIVYMPRLPVSNYVGYKVNCYECSNLKYILDK